jgi:hypothetical protein
LKDLKKLEQQLREAFKEKVLSLSKANQQKLFTVIITGCSEEEELQDVLELLEELVFPGDGVELRRFLRILFREHLSNPALYVLRKGVAKAILNGWKPPNDEDAEECFLFYIALYREASMAKILELPHKSLDDIQPTKTVKLLETMLVEHLGRANWGPIGLDPWIASERTDREIALVLTKARTRFLTEGSSQEEARIRTLLSKHNVSEDKLWRILDLREVREFLSA